jgi:tripartite-type tricarboxylate transporter receptor subunit TctC
MRDIGTVPLLILVAAAAVGGIAHAQPYPSKPLRLIVSSAPGGGTDAIARIVAASLTDSLGQQVFVDNRPGASGAIGAALAAKSAPDGYTLLVSATASTVILPLTRAKLPYDVARDLAPVGLVAATDYVLTVHPSLPVRSVRELVTLAKAKPGQLSFSSAGHLSLSHLAGELFKQHAHVDMLHVPYKGGGAAALAIVGGEVSLMFGTGPSVLPYAKAGKLRMIATASARRSKTFPELPTIGETLPGIVVTAWYGLQVPAGTPKEIIDRLNAETMKGIGNERVAALIVGSGLEPATSSPQQFGAYIKDQTAVWSRVIKSSGIAAQ